MSLQKGTTFICMSARKSCRSYSHETVVLMTLRNFHGALPESPSSSHHNRCRPNSSRLPSETAYRIPSSADTTLVKFVDTPRGSESGSTQNAWCPVHPSLSLRISVSCPLASRTRIRYSETSIGSWLPMIMAESARGFDASRICCSASESANSQSHCQSR